MLTIKQVAELLNVCPTTVYRYVKTGKLKAVKLKTSSPKAVNPDYVWRIREEDFEEFITPKGG